MTAAQLCLYVGCNVVDCSIVALCTGDDSLGYGDDIAVTDFKLLSLSGFENGIGYDGGKIITAADNGSANTAGDCAYCSFHKLIKPFKSRNRKMISAEFHI